MVVNIPSIPVYLGPVVALIAGILVLIMPRLLNYVVAIYLIITGEPFAKLTGSELKNLVRGRSEVFLRQDPNFSLDIADFGHDYPGKPGVSVFL